MPLNDAGLGLAADTVQAALLYAQLHTDAAGVDYDENLCTIGRQPISWGPPTDGAWGLASQITFRGGVADEPVHSVTVWDEETGGTCYGEFILDGDGIFNKEGNFLITLFDFTVIATDSTDGS
jgi:hypothetical protein